MRYCNKCLTTNLRPNSDFKSGVCIACRYTADKGEIDGKFKLSLLEKRISDAKRKQRKKGPYDCIVGVSGGKDSTRQAHWVRDRLGLRPLLICAAYPPKQMSHIGATNLSNLITMGFDVLAVTPAPKTACALALESFKRFGNVCKSTEMALFSTVPRLAICHGVNMIFWGENTALQVGDSAVEGVDQFDGNNLRKLNTLLEGGSDWLTQSITETYKKDHYIYPDEIQFDKKNINIFFLGTAWDDWSNEQNSTYAALQGLTLRPDDEEETGDISNASMLDEEFTNINMMIKYYKFGFGRATDFVSEQIRDGLLSRREGIELIEKYDGVCSEKIIESFCEYVDIGTDKFWEITKKWVNTNLFDIGTTDRPKPKFRVGVGIES